MSNRESKPEVIEYSYYSIQITNYKENIETLNNILYCTYVGGVIIVTKDQLISLKSNNINFQIKDSFVKNQYSDDTHNLMDGFFPDGGVEGYYTYNQIKFKLNDLENKYGKDGKITPGLINNIKVEGKTYQGKTIRSYCLGLPPDKNKNNNNICFVGGIHGNEFMSVASLINFMYWLCDNYSTNSEIYGNFNNDSIVDISDLNILLKNWGNPYTIIDLNNLLINYDKTISESTIDQIRSTSILNNNTVWIIPIVNIDGYMHNSKGLDRSHRKNMNKSCQSAMESMFNIDDKRLGVDLNRNFSVNWGGPGSSNKCLDNTYRGSEEFSEKETQAIRNFLGHDNNIFNNNNKIKIYMDCHSYMNNVTYQIKEDSIHAPIYKTMATEMVSNNDFGIHNWPENSANGTSDQWVWNNGQTVQNGPVYSFIPEIGTEEDGGFFPTREKIQCIVNKTIYLYASACAMTAGFPKIYSLDLSKDNNMFKSMDFYIKNIGLSNLKLTDSIGIDIHYITRNNKISIIKINTPIKLNLGKHEQKKITEIVSWNIPSDFDHIYKVYTRSTNNFLINVDYWTE